MKKKVFRRGIVASLSLLCTFSVVYAMHHELSADTISEIAGGSVTGRVNLNPSNLAVNNGGMQKGDKVSLGVTNFDNETDLGFQLLIKTTDYTYYTTNESGAGFVFPNSATPLTSWIMGSTEPYGEPTVAFNDGNAFANGPYLPWGLYQPSYYYVADYNNSSYSMIQPRIAHLNAKLDVLTNKDKLIQDRDLTAIMAYYIQGSSMLNETFNQIVRADEIGKHAFIANRFDFYSAGGSGLGDRLFRIPVTDLTLENSATDQYWVFPFISYQGYTIKKNDGNLSTANAVTEKKDVRPFLNLNIDHIVFGVSQGSGSGLSEVDSSVLPTNYSSIADATANKDKMKLRLKDDNLTSTTKLHQIENASGEAISSSHENRTVYLNAEAIANNSNGVNTVSAFVFDENNNFKYYIPLEPAKGSDKYSLNLTGIPAGSYKVGIVNEVNTGATMVPTKSSEITAVLPLDIIEAVSLSDLTFTATEDLEYSINADEGDVVGKVSSQNGSLPITYTLSANPNHPTDVQNFELVENQATSDGEELDITIAENGPAVDTYTKSLKAGTYYFTITALDTNGEPVDEQGNPSVKLDVTLVVKKTKPTIEFDENNEATETITGSTSEITEVIQHATHTNKDIINAQSGANDKRIVYTQSSGSTSIFTGLPFTATDEQRSAILVAQANQSGEIVLKATVSATENYEEVETTKTLNVILGLDASYVEDKTNIKAGTTNAKPSTSTPIGHISASGGTTPYTYAPASGENQNGSFMITSDGKIYVAAGVGSQGLTPGNYLIEVKVSDAATPAQTKTVSKTITIQDADVEGISFENPDQLGSAISTITRVYDPSTSPAGGTFKTKLMETVTDALSGTTITYSVVSDRNNVIEYTGMSGTYANFKVKKASAAAELNQVKIKAHISGGVYGTTGGDVFIPVNVNPYEQKIEFTQGASYELENTADCVSISATKQSDYWNQSDENAIIYTSGNTSKFTINSDNEVCPVAGATGSAILTAKLAKDTNYKEATARITINVLGELNLTYTGSSMQAVNTNLTNDAGNAKNEAVFGALSVEGGADQQYNIEMDPDDYANAYFTVEGSPTNQREGSLKLKNGVAITAEILKGGMDAGVIEQDETNPDKYNWTMKVKPNTDSEAQTITVVMVGAEPDLSFERAVNNSMITTYVKDGTIDLSVKRGTQIMSSGVGVNGNTGYQTFLANLNDASTDAQLNGVSIKKANCNDEDQVIAGKSISLTPKAKASDGYKSGTGSATALMIKKANHPTVDFEDPDTILQSAVASIDKGFTGIEHNDAHLTITPKDPITWEGTAFEKIDSGDATEPSVTIRPNGYEGSVVYIVNGGGTDNYKPIVNHEIDLFFSSTGGIAYRPIKITYGDNTKNVLDYIIDENKDTNTYTYAPVEGSSYIDENRNEILTLDSTSKITTKQVGRTKVNVTREDAEGNVLTQAIPIEVIQKEITLTYASHTIFTGEDLPEPSFLTPEDGVLVEGDTLASSFPKPAAAAIYLDTTVVHSSVNEGEYAIKGDWNQAELASSVNANYRVTLQAGQLTIKKDEVQAAWYHLEDAEGNRLSEDDWHNRFVNVILDTASGIAGVYDQISNRNTFTNADKTKFSVIEENETQQEVFFRINPEGIDQHKGAMTSSLAHIKIDMTKPVIQSITGYPVNRDGLSELLHNLTFGMFYRPGVEVTIKAIDPQPNGANDRTVSQIKKVNYKIYTLDERGTFDATQIPETDEGVVDENGEISFRITDTGNYRVCATAVDNALNSSNESCSDLNIKLIDTDVDGNGEPDFNDSNEDGCPDLNIVLGSDSDGNSIKMNVAEEGKKYPYMNIDSNGDGIPDLNIDTDHDNRPDLNLVNMSEQAWVPEICVVVENLSAYSDPVEYCTGTNAKAQINVTIDVENERTAGNKIPKLNIDNNGDMKADLNISIDGIEPYLNIVEIHEWNPSSDYSTQGFFYDSIGRADNEPKRELNIDTNDDGYPDVNVDTDKDGVPNLNIDDDGDEIPDWNIDGNGDGRANINVDSKGDDGIPDENLVTVTEWKPESIVDGDVPYGTMLINGNSELEDNGIVVEKPDGNFLPNSAIKVNDISNSVEKAVKDKISQVAGDKEIKKIYGVEYLENNVTKQPNGKVNVKIPVDPLIKNAKVVIEKKDGSFEEVNVTEQDGYYVFETDYIGRVSILGDAKEELNPKPTPNPSPSTSDDNEPSTSVKGTYTTSNSGMGGANTGDQTNILYYVGISSFALCALVFALYKRRMKE